jgi:N-acetylneuraminic acid mutarotase
MILEDNGGDDLPILANGGFTFKTPVSGAYAVTVKTQPTGPVQTCSVANGTGTATANVTNVLINCGTTGLTIGGSVSGLLGSGLVLQNNGGDNFAVSGQANVPFTFSTPVSTGTAYSVTVLTQPSNPAQVCSVVNGSGTANSNINNVEIICTQPGFKISGSVVGLVEGPGDTLELQNNAGDDLFVTGDTTFTFPTQVTNGGIYNVSMFLPPNSQPQPCNVFFYTGIASTNVSDVLVDCEHNDWGWTSWYLTSTNKANNYAAVTTPLFPPNNVFPPNVSTPGGRDFASAWTDKTGRKWLFGGLGFPYPNLIANPGPAFLNDLWVYDTSVGGWVPANLPIFSNATGVTPVFEVRVGPLEAEDVPTNTITNNALTPPLVPYPGSRWGSSSWTDTSSGDLYLFGGQGIDTAGAEGLLNDVWKCTPGASVDATGAGTSFCPWSLVGGSTTANATGTYGTQGAPGGVPGARWAAATTADAAGNFWLFGGQGLDSAGTTGLLSDLWEYNATANQWTWIGPSSSNVANQIGNYGTQGQGSGTTTPGARQAAVLWADTAGNIWLFGGFGLDSKGTGNAGPPPAGAILNDLWEYNITTKQWIWVSGNDVANQTGTYGSQATSNLSIGAAGDVPGSRWGAVGWRDTNNNLWIYGGWGYGTNTTDPTGFLNDIWEYQQSSGQWIWWKGISNANQNSVFATQTIPFADGVPYVNNVVGGRRGAAIWAPDPLGFVTVFGGEGYDSTNGAPPGYLDDLWIYLQFPN